MRRPFLSILHFSLVLLLTAGCHSPSKKASYQNALDQGFDPEFLKLVTPAFFDLPAGPNRAAMSYLGLESADHDLMSENTSRHVFYELFFTILSLPVVEKPEYWATVINNTERSDLLRLYSFRAFFLRQVKPGDKLDKLATIPGIASWFDESTVRLVGGLGGSTRFEWKNNEDYVEIRMRSELEEARLPITLAVKGSKIVGADSYKEKTAEMLDALRGRKQNPKLVITGIAIY